jgi:hypoxanthine phosphoribosyltransferase
MINESREWSRDVGDLYVSWDEYHRTIERLAVTIARSGWTFDAIICIARGGMRIGDILSRLFDRPLGIVSATSYGGTDGRERGSLTIAATLTTTVPLSGNILLVDDLVDSGASLREVRHWLEIHADRPDQQDQIRTIADLRTAVLWYKSNSSIVPDYYADYLPNNPWIHQPFERYETLSPQDLNP